MARAVTTDGTHLYVAGEEQGASGDMWWRAGNDRAGGGNYARWRVEKRSAATGALRSGFGTSGAVNSLGYVGEIPRIRGLAIDATHCFTIGDEGSTAPRWRIEKRLR